MERPRPGPELLDEERYAALLGKAIEGLESFQGPTPSRPSHDFLGRPQGIKDIIGALRFVRDRLLKQAEEQLAVQAKSGRAR
jgi:hypothetical protein